MFGKPVEGEQVQYWGARAIYCGIRDDYNIDLLPDRQTASANGVGVSEERTDAFMYWLNNRRRDQWRRGRPSDIGDKASAPPIDQAVIAQAMASRPETHYTGYAKPPETAVSNKRSNGEKG